MPRYPLHVASGTGIFDELKTKVIRLARYGCANRPFFHIVVIHKNARQRDPPIEQLGTYDPMENQFNEKLVSLNLERIQYWMGQKNLYVEKSASILLGLAGFMPIHPRNYILSWRNRKKAEEDEQKKAAEAAAAESSPEAEGTPEKQSN